VTLSFPEVVVRFTRRDFLAGSTIAIVGGAFGRSPLAAWQGRRGGQATPVFTPMRRNIGYFTGSGGTVGYLVDPGGVVVVDSQFPQTAKLLLDGLNERSKGRGVDRLINTHHHGDHTGGNIVFKGVAKQVVAHATAVEHQRNPPGRKPPEAEQLYADTTFTDAWREQIGDEWIRAKHYGPAHTSGDAVITFERANVAHMGDLMFNLRHPVIDKPAGASLRNWAAVLDKAAADHPSDTMYIFGHAGANAPVIGSRDDLASMRDYLNALLAFVQKEMKSGRSREEILAAKPVLPGFEKHGPLGQQQINAAFDELSAGY
jgi:glyoxylase-like metal-dependent hydrolase (beta-lactamase superfamily II)